MNSIAKKINKESVKANLMRLSMIMMTLMVACPAVFAGGNHSADVIKGILGVVYMIMNCLGILFVIIGFVKLIISYAQEDAPSQQKSAMFIATGLVLIIARLIMNKINFTDWVDNSLN